MRGAVLLIALCSALGSCAGNPERLAKCSADENPVSALGYEAEPAQTGAEGALAKAIQDTCGPMRPVNQF